MRTKVILYCLFIEIKIYFINMLYNNVINNYIFHVLVKYLKLIRVTVIVH